MTTDWIDEMRTEAKQPDTVKRIVEDIEGAILPMARAAAGIEAFSEVVQVIDRAADVVRYPQQLRNVAYLLG